jgi:hypothetical protein
MKHIESIVARINEMVPALTNIEWEPFRQDAVLQFSGDGSGEEQVLLRLTGVHYFATRQSLLGGPVMNYPEERTVDYFGIFDDSEFLRQFLAGGILHEGQIIVYDMGGSGSTIPGFTKPLHVNVNCSDGILDVICEQVDVVHQ